MHLITKDNIALSFVIKCLLFIGSCILFIGKTVKKYYNFYSVIMK